MLATRRCERLAKKTNARPFLYGCHDRWLKDISCCTSCDAAGSASEHFSECRFGGADAGSTAANVNLIQPREKRKAFNKIKRALERTYPYCHTGLGPARDPTARAILYHRRKLQQGVRSEFNGRRFNLLPQAYFTAATE